MPIIGPELSQIAVEAQRRFASRADAKSPGIREWLLNGGSYYVSASARDKFVAEAADESWSEANGSDLAKYFWAARDSILPRSLAAYDTRSIGWATVAIYYTGLYLCLGLLRSFGYGFMYITSDDCARLGQAPGAVRPESGTYAVTFHLGSSVKVELTKKSVKGFHEGFWRYTDECLKQIAEDIAAGNGVARPFSPQTRSEAILSVEALREWLGKSGTVGREIGWMSSLRNEVNYRLLRNAWSPNYRDDGVRVDRLRQDIVSIVRGTRDRLGVQLQMDRDIRSMVERVSVLFRDVSTLPHFPRFP